MTLNRSPSFRNKIKINTKDNINGWDIYKNMKKICLIMVINWVVICIEFFLLVHIKNLSK